MPKLTLYFFNECPFCRRVIGFMDVNNITVEMKNIRENSDYRHELVSVGGDDQVPCLVVDGKPVYESDDIIAWFKEHKDEIVIK